MRVFVAITRAAIIATVGAFLLMAKPLHAEAPPPPGAALYQDHCSGCHEAGGRAPPRSALATHGAEAIARALTSGVMAPMATGLTRDQIAQIATYLGRAPSVTAKASEPAACVDAPGPLSLKGSNWNGWGAAGDQHRYQPAPGFTASEAPRLKLKWTLALTGDRNGQATVVGDRLFLTSSSGVVYALNPATGCAYWRFRADGGARTAVVVGPLPARDQPGRMAAYFTDATLSAYAIDAQTGAPIWKAKVDDQRHAMMTGSPILMGGKLIVPVSSGEEYFAQSPAYECCQFRGAVVALDAQTGALIWKTSTLPEAATLIGHNARGTASYGPAGAAVWSAPTADAKRGLIYVGTGDSYTAAPAANSDSVLALDAATGALRWAVQLTPNDNYVMGCELPPGHANCPRKLGPDHDIGASPILHTLPGGRQLLLVGQKSGQVYALDPDRQGLIVWTRRVGQGGPLGGVEFSLAADGARLFAPVADIFAGPHAKPGLYALNIADGAPLWEAPSPPMSCLWRGPFCNPALSQAISAMPGVVFAGAMNGHFRAYDSVNGKVIWDYDTGAVLDGSGPTIAGGRVFVVSGYQGRSDRPGAVLMAFSADGR